MPLPYVDPAVQSRLADCRERISSLRRQQTQARNAMEDAKKLVQVGGSAQDVTQSAEFQRVQRLKGDQDRLQLEIASIQQEETYLLGRLAGIQGTGTRENFLQDPTTLEELRMLADSKEPIGRKMLGESMSRDELLAHFERRRQAVVGDGFGGSMMATAGDVTLPSDAARTRFYGAIPQLRRRLTLLDLIPTAPMDVGSFEYLQESGSLDSGPVETSELALKPNDNLALADAVVKAQTIPVWSRMSRPQLADVPELQTVVQIRLMYKVERRLENQIIGGDGTGVNLLGITHTTGIGAPASVAGDTANTDLVLNAVGSVMTSEAVPDAAVLNPVDAIKMFKLKTGGSGQRLDSQGAFSDLPQTIWGLPLVLNTGIPSGHALVGAFNQGATVFIRQGLTTLISDSDQDDFVRNALKILVEGRFGLAIWTPACFAYVPLSFAS
jgi:HK97 family phage major capsid protein